MNDVGSREDVDFGAQSHGPLTRCLRFAVPVTRAPRKTRFRPLARLCRTGLVTRRVPTKGFRLWLPPFPSFPGAPTPRLYIDSDGNRRFPEVFHPIPVSWSNATHAPLPTPSEGAEGPAAAEGV